jgi:hypothetical protein
MPHQIALKTEKLLHLIFMFPLRNTFQRDNFIGKTKLLAKKKKKKAFIPDYFALKQIEQYKLPTVKSKIQCKHKYSLSFFPCFGQVIQYLTLKTKTLQTQNIQHPYLSAKTHFFLTPFSGETNRTQ